MFNWFKKNPKIEFYSIVPAAIKDYSPDNGKKDLVEIFKKISFTKDRSIKKCPGIIEYCKTGYIIKAWQDIKIITDINGDNYQWKTPLTSNDLLSNKIKPLPFMQEVTGFEPDFFYQYFPKPNTLKCVLKLNTPWFIKLPKGYSALFLPTWYDNENRFSVIPGILDPELNGRINVQIYWHALGKEEIIKAGTPLVKIIPFKNETWDMHAREINNDEVMKFKEILLKTSNTI